MTYRLATLGRGSFEQSDGQVLSVPTQALVIAAYLRDKPVDGRDIANCLLRTGRSSYQCALHTARPDSGKPGRVVASVGNG